MQTGDILLVHGTSFVQRGIEEATRSPFCHVALLVESPAGGFLVCEQVEGCGYQCMTLVDWQAGRPNDRVFVGTAPEAVHAGVAALMAALPTGPQDYGYAELFTVWLSGITGREYQTAHEVCSLFVQHKWEAAGYKTPGCAAPGDFLWWVTRLDRLQ